MYKPRDDDGTLHGAGSETASGAMPVQLSYADILENTHSAAAKPYVVSRINNFAERYHEWRERASVHLSQYDLTPDLAQDIGSARWFRGLGTMFGLAAISLLFTPNFAPVEAAEPMNIGSEVRDEFRSQMIMPLALGADSGRRMAPTSMVVALQSAPERPQIELVATLAQGDSFVRMLERAGVGGGEAQQVSNLVSGAMALSEIESGTKVDIVLGRRISASAPRPLDALSFRARFDLEIGVERQGDRLVIDPRPVRVDTTPLRVRGRVGSSLYRSARAAGAPAKAVQAYLRTLASQMDIDRAIGSGDEFDMIVSYKRAATGDVEAGELLYAGVIRDGKPKTQLMRWGKDGNYYEASGVGEQRTGLIAPVPGRITSRYGMRRHPILGYKRMHRGLDFKAGYGTPIYAVTDAKVEYAGRKGGYGNYVKLGHGGGLSTGYAHMSRIAVRAGSSVRRGQVIGYVGSTGLSTGPHLHYEMYRSGKTIDPASVNFVTRQELGGRELQSFRAQLAQLLEVKPGEALVNLVPTRNELAEEAPAREIDRVENKRVLR